MKVSRCLEGVILLVASLLMLASCGGGGGGGGTASSNTISGIASKGPLIGSTVCAHAITASGVAGVQVGSCSTTDAYGNYTLNLGTYSGPVLLEASGGNYVDEATGSSVALASPLHTTLASASGSTTAAVTALTELAYQLASNASGGLTSANIQSAVSSVQTNFGVADIVNTLPVNALNVPASATATQKTYALALAAVSQYQNVQAPGTSLSSVLQAMQACLASPVSNCGTGSTSMGAILEAGMSTFVASHSALSGMRTPVASFGTVNDTTLEYVVGYVPPPPIVQPGSSVTMSVDSSVLVPPGTTVYTPSSNNTVLVNGYSNTILTQAGAIVTVPVSASGIANNLVTTNSGAVATGAPTSGVMVIAGSATSNASLVDGTGAAAVFIGGGHLVLDNSGNIIVSDAGALRKVTQAGEVTTLTQNFVWSGGLTIDGNGNIYGFRGFVSSFNSFLVNNAYQIPLYQFNPSGTVSTNNYYGYLREQQYLNTGIDYVYLGGVAIDSSGNVFLADTHSNRIVEFSQYGSSMTVFAYRWVSYATWDVAIGKSGNIFVLEDGPNGASFIQKITPGGQLTTIPVPSASQIPVAIAVDQSDNVYIACGTAQICRIDASGNVISLSIGTTDLITGLTTDGSGNVYAMTRGLGAQVLKITF